MRPDEFMNELHLLPVVLRQRAEDLEPYLKLNRCQPCRQINDAVHLALIAARYDQLAAAAIQLNAAEYLAREHDKSPAASCRTSGSRDDSGRGRGVVTQWSHATADLTAATDASWKAGTGGIAYVISDGRFGLRGRGSDPTDPTGPSRVLINELRAVEYLLSGFTTPPSRLAVLVDNTTALSYLHRWQRGDTSAMPAGYDLRPRKTGAPPTLVRLAAQVTCLPDVTFQHVKGHTGHPLNEAADALSSMARRRLLEQFDLHYRARDLVNAFLHDWHAIPISA